MPPISRRLARPGLSGSAAPAGGWSREASPAPPRRRPRASPPGYAPRAPPARPFASSATPVSSQEVSMPRISSDHSDTIQPLFRARDMPTVRVKETSRSRWRCAASSAPSRRPASDRAALPRVLRKADRRTQAQACRRRKAPSQAPAQPDAAAEDVLNLKNQITEDMKTAMRAKDAAPVAVRLSLRRSSSASR